MRATAEQVDHDQLLRRIIDEATEATDTQVCSLYLWDDPEKVLILTATNGLAQSGVGAVRLGLGEGVTGWVAAQRASLAVADVRAEGALRVRGDRPRALVTATRRIEAD